jgi:hypothetical protein
MMMPWPLQKLIAFTVLSSIVIAVFVVYGSYVAAILPVMKQPAPLANPQAGELYKQGMAYATGQVVAHDANKALALVTQSAEQGYVDAQFLLGNAYYRGLLGQNYGKAYVWFSLAARHGYPKASALRYEVAANLSPAELIAARKELARLSL